MKIFGKKTKNILNPKYGWGILIGTVVIFSSIFLVQAGYMRKGIEKLSSLGGSALRDNPSIRKFKLPPGKQIYQISQAAETDPKIFEATIDPLDVHVGNKQTLSIIVSSPEGIDSIVAKIDTDHSVKELKLEYVKNVADYELLPQKYSVRDDGKLVFANNSINGSFKLVKSIFNFANASNEPPKLLYSASWIVEDTHDATYHTTFVVKNKKGQENTITLAWSDACGIPPGGDWTTNMYGNCTISAVDGVDNGNVVVYSPHTLTLNADFGFNPGKTFTINTGGTVAIGTGRLLQTYLWRQDFDSDTYPVAGNIIAADTTPTAGIRKYIGNFDDCDDSDNTRWELYYGYYDGDLDSVGVGNWTPFCIGADSSHIAGQNGDCDDTSACVWHNDGFGCVGDSIRNDVIYGCPTGSCIAICYYWKSNSCAYDVADPGNPSQCGSYPGG